MNNFLTLQQANHRYTQVSNVEYDITLALDKYSKKYTGSTKILFEFNQNNSLELVIDFICNSIEEIKINNNIISDYKKDNFSLYLKTSLLLKNKNIIEIKYVNNYDKTGSGFHRFVDPIDGEVYLHTDFEPYDAHRLFPCFDQPDIKAKYKLNVVGPIEWNFIHNSAPVIEEIKSTKKFVSFKETKRFSTYIFALVAGPHVFFEDKYNQIPLRLFCRKSLSKFIDSKNLFDITKESFFFLEKYFDIPYPYEKYDQIFVPEFNFGAMENVGCVTFSESYIFKSKKSYKDYLDRANTIFHEMVHMWFGNLVTMKWWNDLWLNESFADYLSYYAMSKGRLYPDALEHFFSRKDWAYMQDQLSTTHPIVASAEDTIEAFSNFDGISYAKGASVLKQMMFYVGEENFRSGIRNYLKKYCEKNTILDDFLACMSQTSGKDIISWSKQWLETTGVNTVKSIIYDNHYYIEQIPSKNNKQLRDHIVEYEKYSIIKNKPRVTDKGKIFISGNKTKFHKSKSEEFLLLNSNDHDYIKVFFNSRDIDFICKYITEIEDRFSRRIIWGNLWQMVRDNKLSPVFFLELIEHNLKLERENSVIQNQLVDKAIKTISSFLIKENQRKWSDKFFSICLKVLTKENNTEKKKIFFDLLVFSVDSEKTLFKIKQILDGIIILEGLQIDQDKRWKIIQKISAYNLFDCENIIVKEKQRDPSDLGSKKAFQALTAIPDQQLKKKYWEMFVHEQANHSTDFLRYGIQGFLQYNQSELLQPYTKKYFDHLIEIYTERDMFYSTTFGKALFPSIFDNITILEKTKKFILENKQMPKLCKKELNENCDYLERKIPILKDQL